MSAATVVGTEPQRRPGRPRNKAADAALDAAILTSLVEEGYDGMSVERVAARAGVGRATVYRRWATKAEMVVDAIGRHSFAAFDVPDTGDVRNDLESLLAQVQCCMTSEHRIIQVLQVETARHAELRTAFRDRFLASRRATFEGVLRRAIERGQLGAGTDVELLASAGPALIWQQLTLFGRKPSADLLRRIVDLLLPGPASPAAAAAGSTDSR